MVSTRGDALRSSGAQHQLRNAAAGAASDHAETFTLRAVRGLHESFLESRCLTLPPASVAPLLLQMVHGVAELGVCESALRCSGVGSSAAGVASVPSAAGGARRGQSSTPTNAANGAARLATSGFAAGSAPGHLSNGCPAHNGGHSAGGAAAARGMSGAPPLPQHLPNGERGSGAASPASTRASHQLPPAVAGGGGGDSDGAAAHGRVVPRRLFRRFERSRVGRIVADVLLDAAALAGVCRLDFEALLDDPLLFPGGGGHSSGEDGGGGSDAADSDRGGSPLGTPDFGPAAPPPAGRPMLIDVDQPLHSGFASAGANGFWLAAAAAGTFAESQAESSYRGESPREVHTVVDPREESDGGFGAELLRGGGRGTSPSEGSAGSPIPVVKVESYTNLSRLGSTYSGSNTFSVAGFSGGSGPAPAATAGGGGASQPASGTIFTGSGSGGSGGGHSNAGSTPQLEPATVAGAARASDRVGSQPTGHVGASSSSRVVSTPLSGSLTSLAVPCKSPIVHGSSNASITTQSEASASRPNGGGITGISGVASLYAARRRRLEEFREAVRSLSDQAFSPEEFACLQLRWCIPTVARTSISAAGSGAHGGNAGSSSLGGGGGGGGLTGVVGAGATGVVTPGSSPGSGSDLDGTEYLDLVPEGRHRPVQQHELEAFQRRVTETVADLLQKLPR